MAATLTVIAHASESIDALVYRVVGRTSGALEDVLAANPGLAARGPLLPEGTTVLIPAGAGDRDETPMINLWD